MKILKYLLYAILAFILIFLAMGIFNTEVTYGSEISVDKPIDLAWDVSQDQSKFPEWLEGFKSMEQLSGEYMQPGSTYKIIVNPGDGQEDFEMIETLVSIQENDHVEMHFVSDMMDFEQTISFSEADGKTVITTDSKVMAKGIMMRGMFSMMETLGGSFTKQEQKNMDALKSLIESS